MKNKYFIIIIIIAGVIIRFSYIIFIGNKKPRLDAAGYDNIAWNVAQYGEFSSIKGQPTFRRAPVYPIFLALIYKVFGHNLLIARIFQGLLGLLTCWIIFKLGLLLYNYKTSMLAALCALFYPFFIYYTGMLLLETMLVFLITLSLYFIVRSQSTPTIGTVFLSAFTLSMAYLCKPVIAPFTFLSLCILIYFWGVKKIKSYMMALIFIGVFLAPLSLWALRNKIIFGHFATMHAGAGREILGSSYSYDIKVKGQAFRDMIATTDDPVWAKGRLMNSAERDKYYFKQGLKFIRENPVEYIIIAYKKFIKFWRLYPTVQYIEGSKYKKHFLILVSLFSYGILLPFSLFGIYLSFKQWRSFITFYALLFSYTFIHIIFWSQIRYRLPLMPVILLFASAGLRQIDELKKSRLK